MFKNTFTKPMQMGVFFTFLFAFFLSGCQKSVKPSFEGIEELRVVNFTKNDIHIEGNIIMHNPNPVGIELGNTDLDVMFEDVKVAEVTQRTSTQITKSSDFSIPISFHLDPSDIYGNQLGGVLNLGKQMVQKKGFEVLIKGSLDFVVFDKTLGVPVSSVEEISFKRN